MRLWIAACLVVSLPILARAADPGAKAQSKAPDRAPAAPENAGPKGTAAAAKGKSVKLPDTRDNWFSIQGQEADGNNGGAAHLKFKSYKEFSLLDLDPASLKGYVVVGATLHVKSTSPKEPLRRTTVSSFSSEWTEGTSTDYKPEKGSSSFKHRQSPDVPWSYPSSDLCSVMLSQGGTFWRMADATPPDEQGWQTVAIDPRIIGARTAGISYGFLVFDDTGNEWDHDGDKFNWRKFPNHFVYSKEGGKANAPYFTIELGAKDDTPPGKAGDFKTDNANLPAGEAFVSWTTPADAGSGTVGFFVDVDGHAAPRYLIPFAGKAGERVKMHLRDLKLKPGATTKFAVRAVDGAGNVGEPATIDVTVSDIVPAALPGTPGKLFTEAAALPKLGQAEIAIIDELDKVNPVNGTMIPKQAEGYLAANHLFSAKEKRLRLHAARNEFVAFQILLRGPAANVTPTLTFEKADGVKVEFSQYYNVKSKLGPLPDPIVPLDKGFNVPEGQKSGSLHGEVYVPHTLAPGDYHGKLVVKGDGGSVEIAVDLHVWDFTLPDHLSFLCEMNGYNLPDATETGYYRVGHKHRTSVNIVPYSQTGNVHDGWAPKWDGKKFDWTAWDAHLGKYFDGSAFADLPRKNVPLDVFYLPLYDNWPSKVDPNFLGGTEDTKYWAEKIFKPGYRETFVETARQFAEHFNHKQWNDTMFQCFFNDKLNFKEKGWSRSPALWLLDEPASFQDFWALRYFAKAFHEGTQQARGPAKMLFRADISRPMWQRDTFDGLMDYNVIGTELRGYRRMVMDRKRANGELVVEYAGANKVEDANTQAVGWCLDAWGMGTDGVLPWQTIGNSKAWDEGQDTCLFYPVRKGEKEPLPSVRLKAFRRGQQDVEYLTLLCQVAKQPRWAVGQKVREALKLAAAREVGDPRAVEDAGVFSYKQLLPQDAWALRMQVGEQLSQAKPAAKDRLVEFKTPPRDPSKIEGRMVGE